MRDVMRRIERYRLSRYATPETPTRKKMPWLWVLGALWLVWIGVLSDHSLWRIFHLRAENQRAVRETAEVRERIAQLEREASDPASRRRRAEQMLRERSGMAKPGEIVYRIQDAPPDTIGP